MPLLLNCDLGESFGSCNMGMDHAVMPHIDQANIACGFHGGDPVTMAKTLTLAKANQVALGAHPSYPDLVGFGRRSMKLSSEELHSSITYQIAALDGMALSQGLTLDYVKPHGALYNDMMRDHTIRRTIMEAVAHYHRPLKLMLQATSAYEQHQAEASDLSGPNTPALELYFEAFADRCYDDDGSLLARSKNGAVHNQQRMLEQVQQLCDTGSITTVSGHILQLKVDTLCVHGDNMEAVQAIESIRKIVTP
jgi:UPF0271 protein